MIIPEYLRKGDQVGLIAPARKVSRDEMAPAIALLESWGLKVVEGKNLYGSHDQFSGTDEERIKDINQLIQDRSVRALISCRGGYGALRIVDQINWKGLLNDPKWICGYSDVTVFHSQIHETLGISTIHSTMPINFHKNLEATESLRQALFGEEISITFQSNPLNRGQEMKGEVVGGNLSLLFAQMGSGSQLKTKGKILFLEDLDEYLYHIDRMMKGLKRCGMLEDLNGLLIGGMSDMRDNAVPFGKTAEEIISETVKGYDYPVLFDFPAGHIDRNLAIRFGQEITISKKGSTFLASQPRWSDPAL